jgi:hypothetical protein
MSALPAGSGFAEGYEALKQSAKIGKRPLNFTVIRRSFA